MIKKRGLTDINKEDKSVNTDYDERRQREYSDKQE